MGTECKIKLQMAALCHSMDQLFPENSVNMSGSKNIVKQALNEKPSSNEASDGTLDYSITKEPSRHA